MLNKSKHIYELNKNNVILNSMLLPVEGIKRADNPTNEAMILKILVQSHFLVVCNIKKRPIKVPAISQSPTKIVLICKYS